MNSMFCGVKEMQCDALRCNALQRRDSVPGTYRMMGLFLSQIKQYLINSGALIVCQPRYLGKAK